MHTLEYSFQHLNCQISFLSLNYIRLLEFILRGLISVHLYALNLWLETQNEQEEQLAVKT